MANTQKTPWEAFNRDTDLCYSIATANCDGISATDCAIKAPKTITALKINGEDYDIGLSHKSMAALASVDSVSTLSSALEEVKARIVALENAIAKPKDTSETLRRTLKTLSYTKELD